MLDENQKPEKPEGAGTLPAALEKFKWVPGQSGNSKGPTPMPKELRKAFRSFSFIALNCLLDCLTCEDHAVRLRAAEAILTRGFGRWESIVPDDQETPTEDRAKGQDDWSLLSNEQWARFKEIQTEMKALLEVATVKTEGEGA